MAHNANHPNCGSDPPGMALSRPNAQEYRCAQDGPISRPARWVVVARSRGEGLRGDASHPPNSKGWRFPLNGVPEGVRLVGSEVKTWRIEAIRG